MVGDKSFFWLSFGYSDRLRGSSVVFEAEYEDDSMNRIKLTYLDCT